MRGVEILKKLGIFLKNVPSGLIFPAQKESSSSVLRLLLQ
jgi:hypothetical protein